MVEEVGITVVEFESFAKSAKTIMNEEEVLVLIDFLSLNPEAGKVIQGSGGLRKLRWKIKNNKGKSGGSRVIYYYHNDYNPLLLLFVYLKSKQSDLTSEQRKQLKDFIKNEILKYLK